VRSCPLHAVSSSPLKSKWLDRLQVGLSFAGTVLPVADAINATISGGRAIHAKVKGDHVNAKKYRNAALINTAAIVPGVGEAVQGFKTGKKITDIAKTTTKVTKQIEDGLDAIKNVKNVTKGVKETAKVGVGAGSTYANYEYWKGTKEDIEKDKPVKEFIKGAVIPGYNQLKFGKKIYDAVKG
jgi:hypothetical protein